jgi:4'-phosphopantetheinyl transferase EntD
MALAVEPDIDPLVPHPLAVEAIANACRAHEVHGPLLEHTRAHALNDVLLAAILDNNRVDAGEVKQMTEHQAGRTCADDSDLRASHWHD